MRARILALPLLLALAALSGCIGGPGGAEEDPGNETAGDGNGSGGNNTTEPTNTTQPTNTTEPGNQTGSEEWIPDVVLEVTMKDLLGGGYSIDPDTLSVNQNENVSLLVKSSANNMPASVHHFMLEGYDLETGDLGPGDQEYLNFTADTSGDFAYYCSVGNHRQLGMQGTLTVAGST